jgi:type II secretory pathway pseudopilin PulG
MAAGRCGGYSLLELLFVMGLIVTLAAATLPLFGSAFAQGRASGAARYLQARMQLARMEAIKRSTHVGIRVVSSPTGYRYACYVDGNANGVRTADISAGTDPMIGATERLDQQFPGVTFGVLDGVTPIEAGDELTPGGDPIRFGRSDIISFTPIGTSTAGTLYLAGRGRHQYAVRVLGVTGRVRVLRFDFARRKWVLQ